MIKLFEEYSNNIWFLIESKNIRYVEKYLKTGDLAVHDAVNHNLLTYATHSINIMDINIISLLIKYGVDIDHQNMNGNTALIYIAYYVGDEVTNNSYIEQVLKAVIDAGADWDMRDDDNKSFVDFIIQNTEILNWLKINHTVKYNKYMSKIKATEFNI